MLPERYWGDVAKLLRDYVDALLGFLADVIDAEGLNDADYKSSRGKAAGEVLVQRTQCN